MGLAMAPSQLAVWDLGCPFGRGAAGGGHFVCTAPPTAYTNSHQNVAGGGGGVVFFAGVSRAARAACFTKRLAPIVLVARAHSQLPMPPTLWRLVTAAARN